MLLCCNYISAQEQVTNSRSDTIQKGEIFTIVDNQPKYTGGEKARQTFLAQNIKYPTEAKLKNVEGTVYVTFVVEPDGSLSNIKILRGIGSGCDEEVLRVVKIMPGWNPGSHKGKKVRVKINMPVQFKLVD
jgi:protein TonB